ncbi:MAG: hypothetical protein F6K24_02575 [Okeania sp. SIO2D1]|nr:hypothetical protein [Okeania sp. SIO2D1]
MSKIWIICGCFQLGIAASYGLHFLSLILPWWGLETIFIGWLFFIGLIVGLWSFDDVFIKWVKSKVSDKEYYFLISLFSLAIILGVLRWVLA